LNISTFTLNGVSNNYKEDESVAEAFRRIFSSFCSSIKISFSRVISVVFVSPFVVLHNQLIELAQAVGKCGIRTKLEITNPRAMDQLQNPSN